MSQPRIGRTTNSTTTADAIEIDSTRNRQTPRQSSTFKQILRGSAQVLLSGAKVASRVVGLPIVSAAVTPSGNTSNIISSGLPGSNGQNIQNVLGSQGANDDLKLLALQSEIQRHNRQIALLSNVMKARHDTAKAAITNMRS